MEGKAQLERLERLKGLIERVWSRVPAYRAKMDDAGVTPADIRSMEDMKLLPFTTKSDLRDNYPLGLLACDRSKLVRVHASSGTTGKPTIVAYTAKDIEVWSEIMAHRLSVAGMGNTDVFQVILGYGLFTGALGFHWGGEKLGATVVPTGGGFTERQLLMMADLGTTAFTSTPSYALHLAEVIREKGLLGQLDLRVGIFGGEAWTDGMRERLEEGLGIIALDSYGLSEVLGPGVAMECPARSGLHFWDRHFIAEIIDPVTGEVLPDGEEGELVITTLSKEALPVIRYRTRDLTRILTGTCPCGSDEPRIDRVCGRTDDMLIIRGVNVFPSQIETALSRVEGLSLHYVLELSEREAMKELCVLCEAEDVLSPEAAGQLELNAKRAIHDITGIRTGLRILEPGTLQRNGGKAVRVRRTA